MEDIFKLKSKSNYFTEDLLEVVARNRGITDLGFIKNPSKDAVIHYSKLKNIEKITDAIVHFGNTESSNIGIIIDSDADGVTSSAILYSYLENSFPSMNLSFHIHEGKEHGITKKAEQWAIKNKLNLLLVPDSGSGDFEAHERLYDANILVAVIDHHGVKKESEKALVVNSQLSPDYSNKQFSGVGIVYKLLQSLDNRLGINEADNHLDLVGMGNVGDVMDLTSPETRYYVYEGLKKENIKNNLYKEMIFQFVGKWDKLNPTTIAFNIVPKINGLIRFGSIEEKKDMFLAMIDHHKEEKFENTGARSEKNRWESIYQKATRQAKNAHSRQNTAKKKWIQKIKDRVAEQGLDKGLVIPVVLTKKDKFDNVLSGLIAGSLTDYYRKPVLILHDKDDVLMGSMRGYDSFSTDTQELLLKTGLFNWINGHPNAAGCSINKENLAKLDTELMKYVNFEQQESDLIEVDFVFASNQIGRFVVENVHKHQKYWGKGFEEPKLAVTGLQVPFNDIKVSTGGMIKWEVNGIEYTQFVASEELAELAETNQLVTIDVVGTVGINEFMGKENYQFKIDKYEIKSIIENKKQGFGKFIF